jgi:hypothetical protein
VSKAGLDGLDEQLISQLVDRAKAGGLQLAAEQVLQVPSSSLKRTVNIVLYCWLISGFWLWRWAGASGASWCLWECGSGRKLGELVRLVCACVAVN